MSWTQVVAPGVTYTFEYYVSAPVTVSVSGLNNTPSSSGLYAGGARVYGFPSSGVDIRPTEKIIAEFPELRSDELDTYAGSNSIISLLDLLDLSKRPTGAAYEGRTTTFLFYKAPFRAGQSTPIAIYSIRYGETAGT